MARRRTLGTLSRDDIGKVISFSNDRGFHEGVIRSFAHGVYSNASKGEVDVPAVYVTMYASRAHEGHWGTPETPATIRSLSVTEPNPYRLPAPVTRTEETPQPVTPEENARLAAAWQALPPDQKGT